MHRQEKDNHYETRREPAVVTFVETAVTVWALNHNETSENQLSEMTQQLQTVCPAATKVSENPDLTKFYAAKFSEDQLWYRCQIKHQLGSNRVKVHFIDFGNTQETELSSLVEIPATLSNVKPFAKKFVLNNLKPNKSLYDKKTIGFLTSITDQKQLTCIVKHPLKDKTGYYAELFDGNESISDKLISEGLVTIRQSNIRTGDRGGGGGGIAGSGDASSFGIGNTRDYNMFTSSKKEFNPISRKIPSLTNGSNVDKKQKTQLDRVTAENEQLSVELANAKGQIRTLQNEFSTISAKGSLTDHISSALVLAAKVKKLRHQFPADKSPLDDGIDLCKSTERITKASVKSLPGVLSAVSVYRAAMKEISMCKDLKELEEMVETRDVARKDLYSKINICLDEVEHMPLDERGDAVKNTVDFLRRHFDPFFHFVVHDIHSLENLTPEYVHWKETKLAEFTEVRKYTDRCRDEVVAAFGSIQSQLSLTDGEDKSQFDLEALLSNYTQMLQKELTVTDVEHGRDSGFFAEMLQALEKDLKTEVSNIENLQKLVVEFSQIKTDIEPWLDARPNVDELQEVRKTLRGLRSKLRHRLADKEDVEENESDVTAMTEILDNIAEIRDEIHQALTNEDKILCDLSNLADKVFPELIARHPDLGMDIYLTYNGLVKPSHEVDHYELTPVPMASSDLFESMFAGEPVFIREYLLSDGEHLDKTEFLSEVMRYSKVTHNSVAMVKAIFFDKSSRHAYVMFSKTGELLSTLMEKQHKPSEKEIQELGFCVAAALCYLHNETIVHGEVTPQNILVNEDYTSTLLMPDFSRKTVDRCRKKYVSKSGLQFVAPEMRNITDANTLSLTGDLYSTGVLLLWLHCPDVQFGTLPEGTLDYTTAPISQLLKDILSMLLLPSPYERAGTEALLSSDYFNTDLPEETAVAETESASDATASDGSPSDKCFEEAFASDANPEHRDTFQCQSDKYTNETPDEDTTTELLDTDQSNPAKYTEYRIEDSMSGLTVIDHWKPEESSDQNNSCILDLNCKTGPIDFSKIDLSSTNLNFARSVAAKKKNCTSQVFDTNSSDIEPLVCDKQDCGEQENTNAVSAGLMTELTTEYVDKQTSQDEECPNLDEDI